MFTNDELARIRDLISDDRRSSEIDDKGKSDVAIDPHPQVDLGGGEKIPEYRIFVRPLPGRKIWIDGIGTRLFGQSNMDIRNAPELRFQGHDCILAVESWVCFDQMHKIPLICNLPGEPLAVYIGGNAPVNQSAIDFANRLNLPCDAFVSLSPSGLSWASNINNLREIIWPDAHCWETLCSKFGCQETFRREAPAFAEAIESSGNQEIRMAWSRLKKAAVSVHLRNFIDGVLF